MEIGKLNKRITWQSPTETSDGAGRFTVTWSTVATTWAALWPISASEAIKSEKPVMEVTHRIRIRYRSGFQPDYRAVYGTRYFDIKSIINVEERGRWLDILCKESI